MLGYFLKIMNFLIGIWTSLPPETKEKIINAILESFEGLLKAYYQANKSNKCDDEEENNG